MSKNVNKAIDKYNELENQIKALENLSKKNREIKDKIKELYEQKDNMNDIITAGLISSIF